MAASTDSKPETIRAAIGADFRSSTWARRFALLGVVLWLAYEWGPGNETLTPYVLVRVLKSQQGLMRIVVTAAVGFGFTLCQQMASGFTALLGFSMFGRTAKASWARLQTIETDSIPEWGRLGWIARAALVFGLGTTAVALTQIMTTGVTGVRVHARVVAASACLCAVIVGAIGAAVGALTAIGEHTQALAPVTRQLIRVLGNPLVWLGLAAFVLVRPLFHDARRASSTKADQSA